MLINLPVLKNTVFVVAGLLLLFMTSCSVVPRHYPVNKPFVYRTNINLEGNFSKEEKNNLLSQITNQLDDSVRVRTVYKLFYKGFNRSVLEKPPVYDSVNAERSVKFIRALLNSRGYYRDSISYDTSMLIKHEAHPPQYRTTLNFNVKPGKLVVFDSIHYKILQPELQQIAESSKPQSFLKKGSAFSIQSISQEFDRLVELYRENGYLRFTRDELVGIWDTLDVALLRPTFDPFEQILLLEELRKKRENPTANIEIRLRPGYDASRLKKYFVGHTTVYPDFNADTVSLKKHEFLFNKNLTIVSYRKMFKPKFIAENIFFNHGDLYNQKRFLKTIYRFNSLGAWKLVNIEQIPRAGTDTVDFSVYLSPAEKYSFTTNIEGSNNSSFFLDERLLGIGINAQLTNRNFGQSSNHAATSIRFGTEVDTKGEFVKTRQASISHSIFFPKPIPNVRWIPEKYRENFKSVLSFSLGNIERKTLFNLTSLNASWGYNFNWKSSKGKNKAASFKIPNIEYAFLNPRPDLDIIFMNTPSFRNIFNTGLVVSIQGGYQVRGGKGRSTNVFRTNIEESGILTNLIKIKAFDSLFRFVKLDAEFIRNINFGKTSFVFRTYAGAGFAMETRTRKINVNLPFFKQFYAGGPNSMRAWRLRTLGPGSTIKAIDSVPFRFGDFQFETNAEFRFPLTRIGGYLVSSCVFTDIGNVWFLKNNTDFPDGTLTPKNFLADLAVGLGTGLRFDFDFFLLRFDYSLKIKNPTPDDIAGRNKWFYDFKPLNGAIQLGINYPFAF